MRKVIIIITLISLMITIVNITLDKLIPTYLSNRYNRSNKKAESSGIIGGADAPTTLYLRGNVYYYIGKYIFTSISILGIIYLVVTRNK